MKNVLLAPKVQYAFGRISRNPSAITIALSGFAESELIIFAHEINETKRVLLHYAFP